MKRKYQFFGTLALLLLTGIVGCGGGGSADTNNQNSSATTVSGRLTSASAGSSQNLSLSMTMAENIVVSGITVVGTDETGATVTTSTNDSGGFSMDLPVGHSYVISFFEGQSYLGTLAFSIDQNGTYSTTAFRLNADDSSLALGNIVCAAGSCVGDVNPLCSLDRDDDGSEDCEDADDDNDGIDDMDENDSDHDGIEDDLEDSHDDDDDVTSNDCEVIRSRPFNGEMGVDQDEEIRVRFSNALETATVNSENLYLTDASGLISVAYTFENEEEHGEARLNPSANLSPSTEYTLHVTTAIQCSNGQSPAQALEISFTTDDDDSGN